MDHYIEVRILPDPEFPSGFLLNKVFPRIHLDLAAQSEPTIGLSFPGFGKTGLGAQLRVHGTLQELSRLTIQSWLEGMKDYATISAICPVPHGHRFRIVRRVQVKSSPERLRRRLVARKGITPEEARIEIPDSMAEKLNLPYLALRSTSTGQRFRLFVEHMPLQDTPTRGPFSAYGLSPTGSVPWF